MTETPPPAAYQPPAPMSPEEQRTWATVDHVLGIFFSWIAALVIYLIVKDRGDFVRQHARTELNLAITYVIAMAVSVPLVFVGIGVLLLIGIPIVAAVFQILAAVKANNGEPYEYPIAIRFLT